jgi:hypothetical protein
MGDFVYVAGSVSGAEMRVRTPRGVRKLVAESLVFKIEGLALVA